MEITGFFNDIYDYVYIGYIAISQSLIAAYYIIKHKCNPTATNYSSPVSDNPVKNAPLPLEDRQQTLALEYVPQQQQTIFAHTPASEHQLALRTSQPPLALEYVTQQHQTLPVSTTASDNQVVLRMRDRPLALEYVPQQQQAIFAHTPASEHQLALKMSQPPLALEYNLLPLSAPSAPPFENPRTSYCDLPVLSSTKLESSNQTRSTLSSENSTVISQSKQSKQYCSCQSTYGACKATSHCTCVKNNRKCTILCHKKGIMVKCLNPF